MNIHHLELFYYVARHGGIMGAVRNIPYGIQQPAVSSQIAQLEEHLGTTLFQRRPFSLTPTGKKLYDAIQPFFSTLDSLEFVLQGGQARHIRIGASGIILRDHLPQLIQYLRQKFPNLKVGLREGLQPELENLLLQEEIDLAITTLESKSTTGINSLPLVELPLILLVNSQAKIAEANQLWQLDKITEPLICLPPAETICRNFQKGLSRLNVDWFPGIETSSLDLVETYVASGMGIGLSIKLPRGKPPANVEELPLTGFDPVTVGALWRGKMSPLVKIILDELSRRASQLR